MMQRNPSSFAKKGEGAHFWMDVLSAGLYDDERDQIFFEMASSPAGPGRFTLGLDISCCDADRVSWGPCPPRRERLLRFNVTDAGNGAAHAEEAARITPRSTERETRIVSTTSKLSLFCRRGTS